VTLDKEFEAIVANDSSYENALALHIYAMAVRTVSAVDPPPPDDVYARMARESVRAASIFRKVCPSSTGLRNIQSTTVTLNSVTIEYGE